MQPACGSQVSWVHTTQSSQSSGVPFTHSPVVGSQVSAPSQTSPLLQSRMRWLQMCCSTSQLSVVQRLLSSQSASVLQQPPTGGPPHAPLEHASGLVQASPSSQGVSLALAGLEQVPVAGSQVPAVWHWSEAVQTTGLVPVHTPLSQVSVWVQASPSLQAVPLVFGGVEHTPVLVSQVPASWHWSSAVQTIGLAPVQVPFWQVSVCVQGLASLQAAPSAFAGSEQVPVAGSQVPASWH